MQLVYDVEEQAADRARFRDALRQATAERIAADVARLRFKFATEIKGRTSRLPRGTYRVYCRSWQGQWRWLDGRGLVQRAELGLVWSNWREILCLPPLAIESQISTRIRGLSVLGRGPLAIESQILGLTPPA